MKKVFSILSAVLLLTVFALFNGCKKEDLPTLTTTAITSITTTTASSGGNITDDGNAGVTARGVCWGTATKPDITGSKTLDGTGTGSFTSSLTGLTANTTYNVRAYATNSQGTAYGNEVSFKTIAIVGATITTTAPSAITSTTAVSGGNITADGGAAITERGICWATTANPTTANNKVASGAGTGIFTANMTQLLPGTLYHVKAYAINSTETAYGDDQSFTTLAVAPTVTTAAVTIFTQTTATAGGEVTATGGADVSEKGVCYSTTANPTTADSYVAATETGLGAFTCSLTGLTPAQLYHVRAYAKNIKGTEYGSDVTFTTSSVTRATVTTTAASSITTTSAATGGNVTADGGGAVSAKGVCWNTTGAPTIDNDAFVASGSGTGSFVSNLSSLQSGTTYYVRAYATNSAGDAYGNEISFTTDHEKGTLTDIDGNEYVTVKIGDQWWMAENLKTTKYNSGIDIPNEQDDALWKGLTTPAYSWYDNNPGSFKDLYGAIYNWYAASAADLCPTGWHVASDADFNELELFLGVPTADINKWGWRGTTEGAEMKNTSGWDANGNGTNTSGFTAMPAGYRNYAEGAFGGRGVIAYIWTSTQENSLLGWYRRLDGNNTGVYKASVEKVVGKSVRCVHD